MPAVRRSLLLRWFWKVHRWIFCATNGRIGARLMGHDVLLLTTTGRRSGASRSVALYTFPLESGDFMVIASNAGDNQQPAWFLNLEAEPRAQILTARGSQAVRARVAEGEERRQLWERAVAKDGSYAVYDERSRRRIPVVILEPLDPR